MLWCCFPADSAYAVWRFPPCRLWEMQGGRPGWKPPCAARPSPCTYAFVSPWLLRGSSSRSQRQKKTPGSAVGQRGTCRPDQGQKRDVTKRKSRKTNQKATRKLASTLSSPHSTDDAVLMQCLLLGKGGFRKISREFLPVKLGKWTTRAGKIERGKGGRVKAKGPNWAESLGWCSRVDFVSVVSRLYDPHTWKRAEAFDCPSDEK